MSVRQVEIVVTNNIVEHYEARSYPDEQRDKKGFYALYRVPVYDILVNGIDDKGNPNSMKFMAPRFMPYFNNPKTPTHYATKNWVNAGLSSGRTIIISKYKMDYEVQNRYSPGRGAIVLHKAFYIHAGPADLLNYGFGSAGCIEIIGNFEDFKKTIATLSGDMTGTPDDAIQRLVNAKKLIVKIEEAKVPNIKKALTRKVHD